MSPTKSARATEAVVIVGYAELRSVVHVGPVPKLTSSTATSTPRFSTAIEHWTELVPKAEYTLLHASFLETSLDII